MPKKVERALAKQANKKHLKGKQKNAYVYGTMNKLGMLHNDKTMGKMKEMMKP